MSAAEAEPALLPDLPRDYLGRHTEKLIVLLGDPRLADAPSALVTAAAAVRALDAVAPVDVTAASTRAQVIAAATTDLLAGGEVAASFVADLQRAEVDEATAQTINAAHAEVRAGVAAALTPLVRTHADALLAGTLTRQFDAVMARWAALMAAADGRSFDDPASFVGAPAPVQAAWGDLGALVDEHAWVREVEVALLVAVTEPLGPAPRTIERHSYEARHAAAGRAWPQDAREHFLAVMASTPWMPSSLAELSGVHHHGPTGQARPPEPRETVELIVRTEAPPPPPRRDWMELEPVPAGRGVLSDAAAHVQHAAAAAAAAR